MLKKNSAKNLFTASTRIATTNKLPKDFFPRLGKPSQSLQIRKQNQKNYENIPFDNEGNNNGLQFTFYRSRSSKIRNCSIEEIQQQKHSKKRQSWPLMPSLEKKWKKDDKQNNVLQKKSKAVLKIIKRKQIYQGKNTNQISIRL